MTTFNLQGQQAVITGGARGMGYAVAKLFLQSGAKVSLWDVNASSLHQAQASLSAFGDVDIREVDVSSWESVQQGAAAANQAMGGISLLVNSAGIAGVNTSLDDYPVDTWYAVQNVNQNGIFHTCKAIVPMMKANGYGRIANIASVAGKEGNPNASAYSVSKAAVIGLTKSLGKELATSNITANVLCPAVIKTEMLDDVTEEQIGYMLAKIPMGRMGSVEEIASMVAWMCSEECGYTTAAVFDMTGGRATY